MAQVRAHQTTTTADHSMNLAGLPDSGVEAEPQTSSPALLGIRGGDASDVAPEPPIIKGKDRHLGPKVKSPS